MSSDDTNVGPGWGRNLGVALLSAAVLLLQLVQTRIFSMMLWYHLTYLVVTFTMLGFAAGGALLACSPRMRRGDIGGRLSLLGLAFGVSVVGAYVLVTGTAAEAGSQQHTTEGILSAALDYAVLVLPMLFAGLAISLSLADAGQKVGRMYGVNMAGSALGCLLYIPVLRTLGGEGAVMFSAALGAAGGVAFALHGAKSKRYLLPGLMVAAGGLIIALLSPKVFFEVPVAPYKSMAHLMRENPQLEIELTRWDPLCRIDVVGDPSAPDDAKRIFQDGDAATELLMGDAQDEVQIGNKEGLAYLLFNSPGAPVKKAPKVLAIGIGGGIDIVQAQATGRLPYLPDGELVDFTGVEINHTTAGIMREEYAEATGNRYTLPGVTVHVDEGRSWLRRSDEKFDIIQMTGTDTYAALSSGSYVMAESYLYTVEAYDDFLSHLTDDGVISVLRFRFEPPRESLRLAAIAVEALRNLGIENPEQHIILLGISAPDAESQGQKAQDTTKGFGYSHMLVARNPFTPKQISIYDRFAQHDPRFRVLHAPGVEAEGPAADYFRSVVDGTDDAFRASYVYNLDPVTNDSPFFFRYHRWSNLWAALGVEEPEAGTEKSVDTYAGLVGAKPIGLIVLGTVLLESTGLVLLLVLLPLLLFRREGLKGQGVLRWIAFFGGLGAGYMLVEIVVMQRFVLYLGHPGYAMSVVLMTFLLASGAGASLASRSDDPARTLRRSLGAVLILLLALALVLPFFFDATLRLPMPWRVMLTILLLSPLAFVMGMPFPTGLALVGRRSEPLVPWAIGVNGGASVIASVGAILIALGAGFSAAFLVAGACYFVAFLAGRRATA